MNFQVGDITIFPGRGVGKVISIDDIERMDGEGLIDFRVYRIRFVINMGHRFIYTPGNLSLVG